MRKSKKIFRGISLLLCFLLALSFMIIPAMAEEKDSADFFKDVAPAAWYYEDVKSAVEMGLINGKSPTTYAPDDNLTYAEAIKLAACMNEYYANKKVTLVNGTPWYQTYLDYCREKEIISKFTEYNYTTFATREQFFNIFAHALPEEEFVAINEVPMGSIPDYHGANSFAKEIYMLYRAGILAGVNEKHDLNPNVNIKRSEVAAIITRMMSRDARMKFSMTDENPEEEPKTEEPKTEEPLFEIPKDAEILPEVPEEPKVEEEIVETPDMYEPLEIVVEPEKIDSADEGDTLTYTVKAAGGKTPYTYSWQVRDKYNQKTEFTESQYVKGVKTNTLSMVFDLDNSTSSQFCCIVTDALGQTVISDYVTLPEKVFVFKPENVTKYNSGYVFSGRVQKGALRVGETVSIHMPSKGIEVFGVVTRLEMFKKSIDDVDEGDNCGIYIENPEKIPYDEWVVENLGETLAKRLTDMGDYGFKAWMHVTPCVYNADVGEKTQVKVNVFGGKGPYTYKWYMSENSRGYIELKSDSKHKVNGDKVEILVDEAEFTKRVTYKCEVTDATGFTKTPNTMYVVPKTTPYLAYQPSNVYADVGDEVQFYAYSRCSNATYQWYYKNDNTNGWKKIETTDTWAKGATTKNLKIQVEKADFVSHCEYRCGIKNGTYGIVSNSAKILPKSMYITANPENVVGKHGEKVQFKVASEGGKAPYKYQWEFTYPSDVLGGGYLKVYKDYEWAEGETTDTLTVLVDGTKMDSDCKFRCTVTDATGRKATSKEAYIIIASDPNVSFEKSSTKDSMIVIMP
ncbi:MAG: S-layer homology domain-containing protein [Oscillospiraceae bacterium]|nr:S-layer homology domain-containing protein [Oscillospiraceae bacterium]